jgi:N-acetyl-alpha-D-glucosaminyl L-malate synthase BshA
VGKDITYLPVVTFSINESDGVTAVSQSLKEDTYDHFKIRKEIEVIPNFIDFSRFSRTNKEHFRKAIAPKGEKILIHTSNIRKVKRVDDVVMTFKIVREKMPAKLLLVGDGPERQRIETICRQSGGYEDVRFLGKQEAVEELLAVADLFLLPSESESFGLAALEAMACQVPVISSNAGGIPEININGVTGFTSDIGNVEEMAEKSIYLLKNTDILKEFRANALTQAKKFDISQIMPLYETYYRRIIDQVGEPIPQA